jgi:hypothetical protein
MIARSSCHVPAFVNTFVIAINISESVNPIINRSASSPYLPRGTMASNPWASPAQQQGYQFANVAQSNNPFAADDSQAQPYYPPSSSSSAPQYAPFQHQQPTGRPFVPSSAFGQHLSAQLTGWVPSQSQPSPVPSPGQPGQPGLGQPAPNTPSLADLDPFAAISQGWTPQTNNNSSSSSNSANTPAASSGVSVQRGEHPRAYIRSHKNELEAWDTTTWKQAANTYADLRAAWEERKRLVLASLDSPAAGPQDRERYSSVRGFFSFNLLFVRMC